MGNALEARKEFSLDKPKYDHSHYLGRFVSNIRSMNPRSIFTTDAELNSALTLLTQYKEGVLPPGVTDEQLWAARDIKEAIIHPDLGEPIPFAARMCMFVPVNIPVCGGMILSAGGPTGVVMFWQWVNQSYNAAFNFCHRNASHKSDDLHQTAMMSYLSATTVACSIAFGMSLVNKRLTFSSPLVAKAVQTLIPFTAVASAGAFNAGAMRYSDVQHGVEVLDEDGNVYGKSVAAGKVCLSQVMLTRVALPVPILLLPPYLIDFLNRFGVVRAVSNSGRAGKLAVELTVIAACLGFALPAAVAIWPQVGALPSSSLEPSFQHMTHMKTGKPIDTFYFNKGV